MRGFLKRRVEEGKKKLWKERGGEKKDLAKTARLP